MNDVPRQVLREIVARYGRQILSDPRRCRALLMDFCGEHRGEINLLEMALREDVVHEYEVAAPQFPRALLVARMAQRLCDAYYLPETAARWAVESCLAALEGDVLSAGERQFSSQTPARLLGRHWLGAEETWEEIGTTPGKVRVAGDVELRISSRPGDVGLEALAGDLAAFGPVQQLDLSYGTFAGQALEPLKGIEGLLRLDLSRTRTTDAALSVLEHHSQLLELDLWGCGGITDAGLEHMQGLAHLERLELGRCSQVTDRGIPSLVSLPALNTLGLCGTGVGDGGVEVLRQLRSLRRLDLAGTGVTGTGLASLPGLPELWALNLFGCVGLRGEELEALRSVRNLSTLNLGRCGMLTDKAMVHIRPLRSLTELRLEGLNISDTGVLYLSQLHGLAHLDLSWTLVGDAGIARLGSLRGLRELALAGTRLTDAGLPYLASLKGLEYLDISSTGVTDAGLRFLGGLTSLEGLDLEGTDIHDAGLVHLGELSSLRRAYLGRTQITDLGLDLLRRVCNVESVDLTLCRNVTAEGVNALQEAGVTVSR